MTTDPTVHFCGLTHCEGPSHTWVNGAKAYTCHGPNTERRDRYAAAIRDAATSTSREYGAPIKVTGPAEALADAAMAVADEEQAQLYTDLDGANLACWEEEQDARRVRVAAANARKRAARLRGEVSAYKRTLAEADQRKQEYKQACIRLRAEVERMKVLVAASETPGHTVRRMADEAQQAPGRHERGCLVISGPHDASLCGGLWEQQAEPCPGFPDQCPNLITVSPDLPHHDGGIRCGCTDKEPRS